MVASILDWLWENLAVVSAMAICLISAAIAITGMVVQSGDGGRILTIARQYRVSAATVSVLAFLAVLSPTSWAQPIRGAIISDELEAAIGLLLIVLSIQSLSDQRNATALLQKAVKDHEEAFAKIRRDMEKGFSEVKQVVRRAVAVACLVIGILTFASSCRRADSIQISPIGTSWGAYAGLPDTIEVQVKDRSEPIKGATVVFLPMNEHGTVSPATAATDSAGRAKTIWTLGSKSGEQHMVAIIPGDSAWITAYAKDREEALPTAITITPDAAVLTFVGDTVRFTAKVLDQYGNQFSDSVTWSNERQCVFTVGDDGQATAWASGVDSIVAVFGNLRATAPVAVWTGS